VADALLRPGAPKKAVLLGCIWPDFCAFTGASVLKPGLSRCAWPPAFLLACVSWSLAFWASLLAIFCAMFFVHRF